MIKSRTLDAYFNTFNDYLIAESNTAFVSFTHPFMRKHERYKSLLHSHATEILDADSWQESQIGTGVLIDRLTKAIEQKGNNLGRFDPRRFGRGNVPHQFLYEAGTDKQRTRHVEQSIYGLYRNAIVDQRSFEDFMQLAGRKYPLLGYLFFLKDDRQYVPVSPEGFDKVFDALGIELKVSGQCSWSNYQKFCGVIADTRDYLLGRIEGNEVRLIDAHSFLWTLSWVQLEQPVLPAIPSSVQLSATRSSPTPPRTPKIAEPLVDPVAPIDFAENERRRRVIGQQSEAFVLACEKQRLIDLGRDDLAQQVRFVGDDPAQGYDIESYEEDGAFRQIEVKTIRVNGRRRSFFIPESELGKSEALDNYYLLLVTWVDGHPDTIQHIRHPQLRNRDWFALEPHQYLVHFEEV